MHLKRNHSPSAYLVPAAHRVVLTAAAASLLVACGGSTTPPETADGQDLNSQDDYDPTKDVSATAEVGALPEDATINAFKYSFEGIQDCFMKAVERIEFMEGEISLFVQVNAKGRPSHVYATRSTLGDRKAERCMFEALRGASWPKPVGGPIGVAESSFAFEMAGGVRPPVEWEEGQVQDVLQANASGIRTCKGSHSGTYTATAYVDQEGKATSIGISPPDKDAEEASDCLVDLLGEATFASPGSWPAKVTFTL